MATNRGDGMENRTAAEVPADENGEWNNEENERVGGGDVVVRFEPDVEQFLLSLYEEVYDRSVDGIRKLYEIDFPSLTERYFLGTRWFPIADVERFYRACNRYHSLIISLYSELYYRHVFFEVPNQITWVERRASWANYSLLFDFFIEEECSGDDEKSKRMRLPAQWVWDMLDEFVYQFQDTCRWKGRVGKLVADDATERRQLLDVLTADCNVWSCRNVFDYLYCMVERSEIHNYLNLCKDEDFLRNSQNDMELRHQLGYFAMISLLRVHALCGDVYTGLKALAGLDISPRAYYWKLPNCHISLMYHLGFSLMMMRRYNDAIRILSQLLSFVSKQRMHFQSQMQSSSSMRMVDHMYLILLLCNSLTNSRLDDTILQVIKEKYQDKFYKLQQDPEDTCYEWFSEVSPKFVCPITLTADNLQFVADGSTEIHTRQQNLFMKEVNYQKKVANIRSFVKLYNVIQVQKLASLMSLKDNKEAEEAIRSDILCVKQKSRQIVWSVGPLLSGDICPTSPEVDLYMDRGFIYVKSCKAVKSYIDQFLKLIARCQELLNTTQGIPISTRGSRDGRQMIRDDGY